MYSGKIAVPPGGGELSSTKPSDIQVARLRWSLGYEFL
jgi:hypothetical protein